MLEKSKFKKKTSCQLHENTISTIKRLCSRDMGLSSPLEFLTRTNSIRLNDLKLSKTRAVASFSHSLTWLSLDNVENRFLLAAKSDGRFTCFDTFQKEGPTSLKTAFTMRNSDDAHSYSISCVQWYPIDSGMFFTSGMDSKFKVWDTNSLQVVDQYDLNHKIYSHNLSILMSSETKTLIALALDNGQVRFVDLNSGSFTHTLKAHPNSYCVCVQWSPYDPNILSSAGSDGRIAIWDIRSSKSCLMYLDYEKTKLKHKSNATSGKSQPMGSTVAHSGPIIGLCYTQDGNHLISLGKDNTLRLWDSHNGLNTQVNYGRVPLSSAVAETCLQMSCTELCDPNYVFVPSGNNLLMYNIFSGEIKQTFKGHFDSVNTALYNPMQHEVYTGSKDRNILVWSAEAAAPRPSSSKSKSGGLGSKSIYSVLSSVNRGGGQSEGRDNWSDEDA